MIFDDDGFFSGFKHAAICSIITGIRDESGGENIACDDIFLHFTEQSA